MQLQSAYCIFYLDYGGIAFEVVNLYCRVRERVQLCYFVQLVRITELVFGNLVFRYGLIPVCVDVMHSISKEFERACLPYQLPWNKEHSFHGYPKLRIYFSNLVSETIEVTQFQGISVYSTDCLRTTCIKGFSRYIPMPAYVVQVSVGKEPQYNV